MATQSVSGFFVAPFGIDGEILGIERWDIDKLSGKWIELCIEYLEFHGVVFEAPWSGNLSHITTKLTSSGGAALVTFSTHGRTALSAAFATGASPAKEQEILAMFVDSLRGVDLVRAAARSAEPFSEIARIEDRPLMIAIPWPDQGISEQDRDIVRELSTHLAAAYFVMDRPESGTVVRPPGGN